MNERDAYERGFLDALAMLEYKLVEKKLLSNEIKEVVDELRSAALEKRIQSLKYQLGIT